METLMNNENTYWVYSIFFFYIYLLKKNFYRIHVGSFEKTPCVGSLNMMDVASYVFDKKKTLTNDTNDCDVTDVENRTMVMLIVHLVLEKSGSLSHETNCN